MWAINIDPFPDFLYTTLYVAYNNIRLDIIETNIPKDKNINCDEKKTNPINNINNDTTKLIINNCFISLTIISLLELTYR